MTCDETLRARRSSGAEQARAVKNGRDNVMKGSWLSMNVVFVIDSLEILIEVLWK